MSFIVSRHSFGTRAKCVPNGRDGCTFVGWRRAERPHIEREGDYSVDFPRLRAVWKPKNVTEQFMRYPVGTAAEPGQARQPAPTTKATTKKKMREPA
jgi:hypothetical protein